MAWRDRGIGLKYLASLAGVLTTSFDMSPSSDHWMSLSTGAQDPSVGSGTDMTCFSPRQNGSSSPDAFESGLPFGYPNRQAQFYARDVEVTR